MQRVIVLGIALCGAYIAARELAPFRFDGDRALAKLHGIEWLPMRSYSLAKLPQAALDASHKVARFLTLGAVMAIWWRANGIRIGGRECALGGLIAAFTTVLLECAQCWLPGRVPALTDVLLAGVAGAGGVFFGAVAGRWYGSCVGTEAEMAGDAVVFNVELPPPSSRTPTDPLPIGHGEKKGVKP